MVRIMSQCNELGCVYGQQTKDLGELGGADNVAAQQRPPNVVELRRVLERQIRGPRVVVDNKVHVNLGRVAVLVDDFSLMSSGLHHSLRMKVASHRAGSGQYTVINTAGSVAPAGTPQRAWIGIPAIRCRASTHRPF